MSDIAGAPYKIKQNIKQKNRSADRQSVVADRRQLSLYVQ